MERITIKEIAALAGVSIGTVDRVIHNRGHVDPDKEAQIRQICKQHGYEPNLLARAMMLRNKNMKVAVMVNAPEKNTFSAHVVQGFQAVREELKDYNITFDYYYLCDNTVEEQLNYLDKIRGEEYAGLVIKPMNDEAVKNRLGAMIQDGIPIVTVTSGLPEFNSLCFIGQNHFKEGRMAANMLLKCRPFVGDIVIMTLQKRILSRAQKIQGFRSYLAEYGKEKHIKEIVEFEDNNQSAYETTRKILERFPGLEGLYVQNACLDQVFRALGEAGRLKEVTAFSFGTKENLQEYLADGKLAFGIEESPFEHGYCAGKEILNYLMTGKRPEERKKLVEAHILIEESVNDAPC